MRKITLTLTKYIVVPLFFCCIAMLSYGQTAQQNKLLKFGDEAYVDLRFYQAIEYYEEYLKQVNSVKPELLKNLADSYWQTRNYSKAYKVYKLLYPKYNVNASAIEKFRIGELYARFGDYKTAAKWMEGLPDFAAKSKAYTSDEMIADMKQDSLVWKITYLDMNTKYREFAPLLTKNNLLFSSNRPVGAKKKAFAWDGDYYTRLWQVPFSQLTGTSSLPPVRTETTTQGTVSTKYKDAKNLAGVFEAGDVKPVSRESGMVSTRFYVQQTEDYKGKLVSGISKLDFNVGSSAMDKDSVIYFTSNYEKSNKTTGNRLRIMQAQYSASGMKDIKALPFGDPSSYSVMHPAVNSDGTILVFSSDKKGGPGQFDLFYSRRDSKSQPWREPFMMPGKVNSSGNEVFPTITSDGYLYYSSDGKEGLGGLDLYKIKLEDALVGAGEPQHLPYPLNSAYDDFGWTQSADGKKAFFSSDRLSNEDNIFVANYDENAAQDALLARQQHSLQGYAFDKQTSEPLKGATVFLYSKCDGKVYVTRADEKGKYSFPVNQSCDVQIVVTGKGFGKDCLTMKAVYDKKSKQLVQSVPHDLLPDKFAQNAVWRLNNIHYDFDRANIRPDARITLDSVVMILKAYPIKVELSSHTDSRGTNEYNDALSQRRADAAVEYILSKGVDPNRIVAKGYGKRQLLNKCSDGVPCSEEEHQANRRTEIKVIQGPQQQQPDDFDPAQFKDGQVITPDQLPKGFLDNCK